MLSTGSDRGVSLAIWWLHSFLPLSAALYYFIASIIHVAVAKDQNHLPGQRFLRNVILLLKIVILITYGVDAITLVQANFDEKRHIHQDSIVFALGSLLLWFVLLLGFNDSGHPFGHQFWGCWALYLVTESSITALCAPSQKLDACFSLSHPGIQALRLSVLILLCCIPAIRGCYSRLAHGRVTGFDEECTLLLSQGTCHDDRSGGNINYSTLGHNRSPATNRRGSTGDVVVNEAKETKSEFLKSLDTFRCLIPFLWPKGKFHLQLLYIGVGLCLITDRVLNVLVPLQLGVITDALSKGDGRPPWKEILIFVGLRLLDSSGGVSAIRRYMWLPLENYSYQKITTAAFNQIMDLSSDFHDNKRSGSLWQSVYRGSSIRHIVASVFFQIGPMLADLFLAVSVLYFLFGAYMGLITAAVMTAFLWSSGKILSKQKDKRRQWISAMEQEHNILCESTTNWRTVSYFNRIPYEKYHFSSAVREQMSSSISFKLWSHLESVVQSILLVVGLMGACSLAAYQVVQGSKPVGSFVMLLGYWAQLSSPLQFFASGFCDIALDLVNAEELVALLKRKPTIRDQDGARPLKLNKGEIRFDGVNFSYDGRREVLKGISFEAWSGQTVALVGETGGGKSTILKLLFRFYDPVRGSIKIDGEDIRNVTVESLRANIGVVPQDPALFHDSIMNNIRYAKSSATDEEIYEACKAVALHEKFLNLPDGYQTLVGERGIKLSGGELQRVAIARAIIKDPKIVLLDEATSSVDSNTESQIQQSLRKLTAGRTTVVIAHRLSTIVNADNILVIRDGSIIERGAHRELVKLNGFQSRQTTMNPQLTKCIEPHAPGNTGIPPSAATVASYPYQGVIRMGRSMWHLET
ncbi:hypothetical protein VTN77DRAFT_158 [Rasamsonia byssochlamydoides]|uniref:uncharacterized protein n=1 Tax=Rasamsonia byssochlamydoides TaxID=89139 RepID=UPI0037429184